MLKDTRRIPRRWISMDVLPDWPKWTVHPNDPHYSAGEAFIATNNGKFVLGYVISEESCGLCTMDVQPEFPEGDIATKLGAAPDWRVDSPKWVSEPVVVDMNPAVDLSSLGNQYVQTIFGSPMSLFVKSALTRARMGIEKDVLITRLSRMLLTPDALTRRYATANFDNPALAAAFETWRQELSPNAHPHEAMQELIQRETQLQVLILLELLVHAQDVERLLDLHFERLCIWQAISGSKTDQVVEFCSQDILPFFRSTLPRKVKQLLQTSKGVINADQKVPGRRRKMNADSRPSVPRASETITSSAILANAVSSIQQTASPELAAAEALPRPEPIKATKSLSRNMRVNQKRQIEMSFGPLVAGSQHSNPKVPKLNKKRVLKSKPVTGVDVQATPQASRRVVLPKEEVPFDFDMVDSTDSDS